MVAPSMTMESVHWPPLSVSRSSAFSPVLMLAARSPRSRWQRLSEVCSSAQRSGSLCGEIICAAISSSVMACSRAPVASRASA